VTENYAFNPLNYHHFFSALLDRRGAEPDERSESDEVGWWNKIKEIHHPGLCLVTFGASPESTPPVQEGSL
jgi:hypothetical protein